jgi:MFS family permease
MDAAEWRRCVRLSVTEGALATAMGTLMSGVVLTGFALALGASRPIVGLLAAMPSLANVAQILGARWLNAGVDRKRMCIRMSIASRSIWLVVLAIPLIAGASSSLAIITLVAVVAASSVLGSLGGVAWLSWIRDLVPAERRLGFLGLRNQFDTALALTVSALGAVFIDWRVSKHPGSIDGFVWVLIAAVVCGLIGIPILNRMHNPARSESPRAGLLRAAAAPKFSLGDRNFRNLVFFYVLWNLSFHLTAPFFVVFLLEKMSLPFWHITALHALGSIAALVANRSWTALGARIGTRRVVFLATLGDAFYPLCWMFLTSDSQWALPFLFLFGAFNTPLAVGSTTLVMRLAPDEKAPSYLAAFNAVIGVVAVTAAILGGVLATSSTSLPGVSLLPIGGLKLLFLLSFSGRLGSLALLRRVSEPDERPLGSATRWLQTAVRYVQPRSVLEEPRSTLSAPAMVEIDQAA